VAEPVVSGIAAATRRYRREGKEEHGQAFRRNGRNEMSLRCTHLDQMRDITPNTDGCERFVDQLWLEAA